jgi:hypothetical protein
MTVGSVHRRREVISVDREKGIGLRLDDAIDLGSDVSVHALIEALAMLPQGCTLYLEEASMASDVRALVERSAVPSSTMVVRGTIRPKSRIYHVAPQSGFLSAFLEMSYKHAAPELCDHLVVYREEGVLLEAYDFGDGHVRVSRSLPNEILNNIRAVVADD